MSASNDFSKLMKAASENRQNSASKSTRCLQTTFKPPKKVSRESVALSQKVKEFLAKKDEEQRREQEKKEETKRRLLEIRSEDSKAHKRVQLMRKSTKSASKSVFYEADDADPLAQMRQPDEDDYGFSSKTESEMYEKMVRGFVAANDDKKFSPSKKPANNLSATKQRVQMALEKEQLEAQLPHRRKRKQKQEEGHDDYSEPDDDVHEAPPPKSKKLPPPPPMNFMDMLKVAQQNKDKPMLDDDLMVRPAASVKKSSDEPERPMTKRERAEYLKEKQFLEKKAEREALKKNPAPVSSSSSNGAFSQMPKIPKIQRADASESGKELSSKALKRPEKPNRDKLEAKTKSVEVARKNPSGPERSSVMPKKQNMPDKSSSSPSPRQNLPKVSSDRKMSSAGEQSRDKGSNPNNRLKPPPGKILQSALQSAKPSANNKPKLMPSASNEKSRHINPPSMKATATPNRPDAKVASQGRPDARISTQQRPSQKAAVQGRPDARVGAQGRPDARVGAQARPDARVGAQGRPDARAAAQGRPDSRAVPQGRPDSRAVPQGRPDQRVMSQGRPDAKAAVQGRPDSRLPSQGRPDSRVAPAGRAQNPAATAGPSRAGGAPAIKGAPLKQGAQSGGPQSRPNGHLAGSRPPGQRPPINGQRRPMMGNGYPPGPRRPMMKKKRMVIDSDSEYDSEMDDFIDDTPLEGDLDISSVLKEVFRYDKRRYAHEEEDDDECMESSYSQINKEEFKSAKAGMLEDLADIQKKKAMKAAAKKRKGQ